MFNLFLPEKYMYGLIFQTQWFYFFLFQFRFTVNLLLEFYVTVDRCCNCIIRRNNGKLFGCNTDYVGAISAIEDGLRGLFTSQATQGFFTL